MAKLTLTEVSSLQNETSAINTLNQNFAKIEAAMEKTLSRDGTVPNEMNTDLDMNSNRILNLPQPVSDTEPVRKIDIDLFSGNALQEIQELVAGIEVVGRVAVAADRGEMKIVDTEKITTAYLSENGRHGWFKWQTGDFSSQVAIDTVEGIYVPHGTIPITQGCWVRQYSGPASVLWFGARNDGVGDSHQAFQVAVDLTPHVYVPAGFYSLSKTLQIHKTIVLEGVDNGSQSIPVCELDFAPNVTGIIVHRSNTFGDDNDGLTQDDENQTFDAGGSVIRNLSLIGGGWNESIGHGIRLLARATIENVYISNFAGDGIHIWAAAGGDETVPDSNANNFFIKTVAVVGNGGHGVFVEGPDANAGVGIAIDASNNVGWGIFDSSFLGNTWIACHTADNGEGPYKTDDLNSRSVFLGCYSESGQAPSDIIWRSLSLGGLHEAGMTPTSPAIDADQGGLWVHTPFTYWLDDGDTESQTETSIGGEPGNGTFLRLWGQYYNSPMTGTFRIKYNGDGDILADIDNFGGTSVFYITGSESTGNYGRGETPLAAMTIRDLLLWPNSGGTHVRVVCGVAPPSDGSYYEVGDIIFNSAPEPGGNVGWICTTAGIAGDSAVFLEWGAIESGD